MSLKKFFLIFKKISFFVYFDSHPFWKRKKLYVLAIRAFRQDPIFIWEKFRAQITFKTTFKRRLSKIGTVVPIWSLGVKSFCQNCIHFFMDGGSKTESKCLDYLRLLQQHVEKWTFRRVVTAKCSLWVLNLQNLN